LKQVDQFSLAAAMSCFDFHGFGYSLD